MPGGSEKRRLLSQRRSAWFTKVSRCCTSASRRLRHPPMASRQVASPCARGCGITIAETPKGPRRAFPSGAFWGWKLRRAGSGHRLTFDSAEAQLSEWMGQDALVSWTLHTHPWELEHELIAALTLPLNLQRNSRCGFYQTLHAMRSSARTRARASEVLDGIDEAAEAAAD
jgi:hypothetical protein